MTITEFLKNVKFYNKAEEEKFLDIICKALEDCIYCGSCSLHTECEKAGIGYYCRDILKKHLTIK